VLERLTAIEIFRPAAHERIRSTAPARLAGEAALEIQVGGPISLSSRRS
jgi:hypothetical protein